MRKWPAHSPKLAYDRPQAFKNAEEAMGLFQGARVSTRGSKASTIKQSVLGAAGILAAGILSPGLMSAAAADAPKIGDPPEAMNMRLVGMNDLQGRSAYQPT